MVMQLSSPTHEARERAITDADCETACLLPVILAHDGIRCGECDFLCLAASDQQGRYYQYSADQFGDAIRRHALVRHRQMGPDESQS